MIISILQSSVPTDQWGLASPTRQLVERDRPYRQVFAGRTPFSGECVVAGVSSISDGHRPQGLGLTTAPSPILQEVINGYWKGDPAQRKALIKVTTALYPLPTSSVPDQARPGACQGTSRIL